jgi:pantothenate kinase
VSKDDKVGVPNTVDSSKLMAAKKEVSKKDVETEAPAFQKEKDDALDTRPSKGGVPRSFDMDHHCSIVTRDNNDPALYITRHS